MDRQPDDTPGSDRSGLDDTSSEPTAGQDSDRDSAPDWADDRTEGRDDQDANRHASSRALASDEQYCSSCGERIKREAEICPHCGVRVAGTSSVGEKDPGIAAVISLIIPGGGQVYNEQIVRGAVFFGAYACFWMFVFLTMLIFIGFLFMFLAPVFHLVAAWDAYAQANKINNGEVVV